MVEPRIEKIGPERADEVIRLLDVVFTNTYVKPGILPQEAVDQARPTDRQVMANKLEKQDDPSDLTKPHYIGFIDEDDILRGLIKTAKPTRSFTRYYGEEPGYLRAPRKLGKPFGLFQPRLKDPTLTEFTNLVVHPEKQRQNIGTKLVHKALNNVPEEVEVVRLFTRLDTISFFSAFGFQQYPENTYFPNAKNPNQIPLFGMHRRIEHSQ